MEQFHVDYMIIGVEKAGTTSMIIYLVSHKAIWVNLEWDRSSHFFNIYFNKGIDFYKSWYGNPVKFRGLKIGERTHDYIYFPRAAQRIKQVTPNTKFILMLRNPIDRAYSQWNDNATQKGRRDAHFREYESFETALDLEEKRIAPEREKVTRNEDYFRTHSKHPWDTNSYSIHAYLAKGRYAEQLKNWLKFFPLEQMIIIKSEDFFEDPNREYRKVQQFLGVNLQSLKEYKNFRPSGKKDTGLMSYPPMKDSTRNFLVEYFKPHNEELYNIINRDMRWK